MIRDKMGQQIIQKNDLDYQYLQSWIVAEREMIISDFNLKQSWDPITIENQDISPYSIPENDSISKTPEVIEHP